MQVCKIGCIDCVHAKGLAWILSLLYSTRSGQWSEYAGHPDESLAKTSVYSRPVTGCKSGVRARIYTASHKPNTIVVRSVVVSCWSCTMLNLVSGCLLTCSDVFKSPVQSSTVHFSQLISDTP